MTMLVPTVSANGDHPLPSALRKCIAQARDQLAKISVQLDLRLLGNALNRLDQECAQIDLQCDSLPAYVSHESVTLFGILVPQPQSLTIAPHPYIRPLLPFVLDDRRFYVLRVRNDDATHFRASRHQMMAEWKVELPSASDGFAAATAHLRQLDAKVSDTMLGIGEPLVFAGDATSFGRYREITRITSLLPSPVTASEDAPSDDELDSRCWTVVESLTTSHSSASTAVQRIRSTRSSGRQPKDRSTCYISPIQRGSCA